MAHILPYPKFRATTKNGEPLVGGLLRTYEAGTATPLATFTNQAGDVPNTNPVVLDANGEASVWLSDDKAYKFVLFDEDNVQQWSIDNISHVNVGSITNVMLKPGILSNDEAGHALMAPGYFSNDEAGHALMAPGYFSNDTAGHALMADDYLSANTEGRKKMQNGFFAADAESRAKFATGFVNLSLLQLGILLGGLQKTDFLTSGTITVPAGSTRAIIDGWGGGGCGATGANNDGTTSAGAGGGGGASGRGGSITVDVAPGDVLQINIGAGGSDTGGARPGGNTIVTNLTTGNVLAYFEGGKPGSVPTGNVATSYGAGGLGGANSQAGGRGGIAYGGVASASLAGESSLRSIGGFGVPTPDPIFGGGSGGGGGSGFGQGGAGGNGGSANPTVIAASVGLDAAANSGAGGGGGGGAWFNGGSSGTPAKGGKGGSGRVSIYF